MFQFLVGNACFYFCQGWCSPGVTEILGSWVGEAVRAATSPRTSRGSTGRVSAKLNVEHSSPWLLLNLESCGPGKMDE